MLCNKSLPILGIISRFLQQSYQRLFFLYPNLLRAFQSTLLGKELREEGAKNWTGPHI